MRLLSAAGVGPNCGSHIRRLIGSCQQAQTEWVMSLGHSASLSSRIQVHYISAVLVSVVLRLIPLWFPIAESSCEVEG